MWRLTTARFARSAFSGEGARLYPGRWNRKGVPLVYTSSSRSLAMLEMLVQDEPLRARYVMIEARLPASIAIGHVRIDDLPSNWRDMAAREQPQRIGSDWARRRTSAVLAVPSAVIPAEMNYLLDPLHPEFRWIEIGRPQPFETDLRLIRVTSAVMSCSFSRPRSTASRVGLTWAAAMTTAPEAQHAHAHPAAAPDRRNVASGRAIHQRATTIGEHTLFIQPEPALQPPGAREPAGAIGPLYQ